jgi:hypothetical protein
MGPNNKGETARRSSPKILGSKLHPALLDRMSDNPEYLETVKDSLEIINPPHPEIPTLPSQTFL